MNNFIFIVSFIFLLFKSALGVGFENVILSEDTLEAYSLLEVRFGLTVSYSNPFDPEVIEVNGHIALPSGDTVTIPCFWYQGFTVNYGSYETYTPVGPPEWRLRYTPIETGTHYLRLSAIDSSGIYYDNQSYPFTVKGSRGRGFVRRDPANPLYLRFEDGTPYIPIGHNVAWDDHSGIAYYDYYFKRLGAAGENWSRIWMTPFARLALEWYTGHWSGYYDGLGQYAQEPAFKIDSIIAFAEREGIYLQICFHSFNELSTRIHPFWHENPYNQALGGMLNSPEEFFTNIEAKALSKKKYRYIVARWGYSTHILAWEFWNEVEFTDNYHPPSVADWHQEMASYVDSLDVNKHLITTSGAIDWSLPEIDIVQIHYYGDVKNLPGIIRGAQSYGKPVIVGEFGGAEEPEGVQLHKGIWSALMAESGAMFWWWGHIEHHNLYYHFPPLVSFVSGEDFARRAFKIPPEVTVSGGHPVDTITYLYPQIGWAASIQDSFEIQPDGTAPGIENLSRYIQGTWHEYMGRRAVFVINASRAGGFGVDIQEISPYGNAQLQVFIDQEPSPVLDEVLSPGDEGIYWVTVSPGIHHIRVYNAGIDWFRADRYIFTCLELPVTRVHGLTDSIGAYLWFYDKTHEPGNPGMGFISGALATLRGLSPGTYTIEFWNTYPPGGILTDTFVNVSAESLIIALPDFAKDIAAKVRKVFPVVEDESRKRGNSLKVYPSVVSHFCEISFYLEKACSIRLVVYDKVGRKVSTLLEGNLPSGRHLTRWQPVNVARGVYFIRLEPEGGKPLTRKLIIWHCKIRNEN